MDYRNMAREEIDKFWEIDRKEVTEEVYYHLDGQLKLVKEYHFMTDFAPGDRENLIERLSQLFDGGGQIIGAFDGSMLVGITAVENKLRGQAGNRIKLEVLFVSASYRGQGIGRELVVLAKKEAQALGGSQLYISATPSKNTVNFYRSLGCHVTAELDPELFELEPQDIHLELDL